MKIYTANELQAIVDMAYKRGLDDGRNRRGYDPEPPRLSEIVDHPMGQDQNTPMGRATRHRKGDQ